jgi:hypothetical protein
LHFERRFVLLQENLSRYHPQQGGIIGNPVRIGSGPATVSSDDPRYGLGKMLPEIPASGSQATVIKMGRRGRKDDLQARRPARMRPALSSTVKKAEVYVYVRIIKTFNPRP